MKRLAFITMISGLAIAWPIASYAQQLQSAPLKRVGVLSEFGCALPPKGPLRDRLAELGWFEGRNFVFDCVSTIGRLDQLPALAHELVSRSPDVLMVGPAFFARPLMQATTTIPIVVFATGEDPVGSGLVTNLARPEGNVTGVAWFGSALLPKRIELLKEILPHLKRLALIGSVYANPTGPQQVEEQIKIAAGTLGFTSQSFRVILKTAKALGLTVPPSLLASADKVIE